MKNDNTGALAWFSIFGFGLLTATSLNQQALAQATGPRESLLVSAEWVRAHVSDPDIVLLHVGDRKDYDAGHIAGARFLPMDGLSINSVDESALSLEMPGAEDLRKHLESLGVSDASRIVVYLGGGMVPAATRVVFTLDAAGLGDRVFLMDGGMQEWRRASYPVTANVVVPRVGQLAPLKIKPRIVDAAFVQNHLNRHGYKIIDARASMFYDGLQAGGAPADKQPKGHIPGAVSVPFTSMTGVDQKLKPAPDLAAAFKSAGVATSDRVIVYCHVGWQGTAVVFAARSLGIDAVLYDGSFQDWSKRGLPVDGPVATK